MSEFTSTKEGFQRAMEMALTGPSEEAQAYGDALLSKDFYSVKNGQRFSADDHIKMVAGWRGKISDYKPEVKEFLRDGDQLAARMDGTIKVEGGTNAFETFIFAKVEKDTGKLAYMIQREVYGPVGEAPTHGA